MRGLRADRRTGDRRRSHPETPRRRWPGSSPARARSASGRARPADAQPRRGGRGLALLHTDRHTLDQPDARLSQALADAATIGLLHERALRHAETVHEQLQSALDSRVIIEQAKGVIAAQGGIGTDEAFTILRGHARSHGQRLSELARSVVDGSVDLTSILRPAP